MNKPTDNPKKAAIAVEIVGQTLVAKFANGQALTVYAHNLADNIRQAALMHGLKQKLVDAAAISRDPTTGRPASIDVKFAAVKAVYDRITMPTGAEWNAPRGEGEPRGGLLFMALCRMYDGKKTDGEIRDFLAGLDKTQQAALRRNPKVVATIEDIRAELVETGCVDTDSLLAELDA